MENKINSSKKERQGKFLLVLPLLALPFLTVMFWALGGGKASPANEKQVRQTGFNTKLPDPDKKPDKPMDKLDFYNQAQLDSAKFREQVRNDPNYRPGIDSSLYRAGGNVYPYGYGPGLNTSLYGGRGYNDPHADQIYRRLSDLDRTISDYGRPDSGLHGYGGSARQLPQSDVEKLQQMMHALGQSNGEDPEMAQLNGMLEKILDIQNPNRAQEKLRAESSAKRGQVFAVSTSATETPVSLIDAKSGSDGNGFYSLDDEPAASGVQNAIQAVVHETQTLVQGSTVKLRLANDVFVNGIRIPKDNFLYGTASLNGERLEIAIASIRFNNSLYPVELSVYDLDGIDGIFIPGAITRDVAKESVNRSSQNIGIPTLESSWGAEVAGAGIEAAKSLIGKKVKLIKVTVKAGYQVLLRDEKQKQNTSN